MAWLPALEAIQWTTFAVLLTRSSVPTVNQSESRDWIRLASGDVAPAMSFDRSPFIVEVRMTAYFESSILPMMMSGWKPTPVMARLSVALPV